MEKKKIGRPPLPKGESKAAYVTARLTSDEATELAEAAEENGRSQSEEARRRIAGEHFWIDCKWSKADLDDQKVKFHIQLNGQWYETIGELSFRERPDGKKRIDLLFFYTVSYNAGVSSNVALPQEAVDSLVDNGPSAHPRFELTKWLRGTGPTPQRETEKPSP
jgi:hypothetical protein